MYTKNTSRAFMIFTFMQIAKTLKVTVVNTKIGDIVLGTLIGWREIVKEPVENVVCMHQFYEQ